jgi:CBS domain-containing protein
MLVEQLMNRPAITCRPYDSCHLAAGLMWESDVGVVPVVGDDGCVCGMITDRDISMAAYLRGLPLSEMQVSDVMARDVFTCRPGDPLGVAEKIMSQCQVRRLPVIDQDGHVVGVLSLNDLAREAEQEGGRRRPDVSDVDVSRTLAAIGHPRRQEQLELPPP